MLMLSDVVELAAGALKGWLLRRIGDGKADPETLDLKLVTAYGRFLCVVTLEKVDRFDE